MRPSRAPKHDVICVVDEGVTATEPPATYPWPANDTTPLPAWFDDIVGWWQDPERADGKAFTHGQRLRDWSGDQTCDQLSAITDILANDTGTSRGIAVLVNPEVDKINDKAVEFPSFSLLHLWISDGALHCSAFFRKQEMTFWWPVNAAELARIQADTLQRLRLSEEHLIAGTIRTYASEAVFSDRLPKVNVPRIDRQFWQNPAALSVLAVAVADSTLPGRRDDITTLLSLMDDWVPEAETPPTDGAAVPVRGLEAITEMLEALAERYPGSPARDVSGLLRDMDEANKAYLNDLSSGDPLRLIRGGAVGNSPDSYGSVNSSRHRLPFLLITRLPHDAGRTRQSLLPALCIRCAGPCPLPRTCHTEHARTLACSAADGRSGNPYLQLPT